MSVFGDLQVVPERAPNASRAVGSRRPVRGFLDAGVGAQRTDFAVLGLYWAV
jgi:hypothetical protein